MAIREKDLAIQGPEEHPLSLTRCAVCLHYKCHHDNQGCFLDAQGKRSQDPGILGRAGLKASGSQCWCPKFVTDPNEAADLTLQLGNSEALRRGAVEALDREDNRNSRRLMDQYILKTSAELRDNHWIEAMQRRLQ